LFHFYDKRSDRTLLSSVNKKSGCIYLIPLCCVCGTGYLSQYSNSLWAGWSGDRILVGARCSAPVETSPGAHPASYTTGTRSFTGVKRPEHGTDHPPLTSAKVKERVELDLYTPSGPSWPVLGWTLLSPFHAVYESVLTVVKYVTGTINANMHTKN